MRYLILLIFLFLVSCTNVDSINLNSGYYIGITSFNRNKNVSFINQYDEEGKETNKIKFSVEGMGYLGELVPSDDDNFYFKSSNVISPNGKNYLISVDKLDNRYSKIDLNFEDIYKIVPFENYLYITHSFNKLSVYDKNKRALINTVQLDDYVVSEFYVDEFNIYVFSRLGTESSFLNILDREAMKFLEKISLNEFGLYQNDIFYHDGKIYFTNYDASSSKNIGKIGIYDIEDEKFSHIDVQSKSLDKILANDEKIFVVIKGDESNILKDTIMIIDKNSLKSEKVKLDYLIKIFDIIDDKILILSNDYLDIYDVDKFKLDKRIELSFAEDDVISGLILYD